MQHNSSSFGVLFTKFSTNFSFVFFQETVQSREFLRRLKGWTKNKQTDKQQQIA